jgi:hypothetical protein
VAQILIKLEEADNPQYYALWREHNDLKKRWNDFNIQIHKIKIPKLMIWRARKKLNKIGPELAKLQRDYLDWSKRTVNFQMNPNYKIVRNENAPLVFLQATANMRTLTDMLESNMVLIVNNYNLVHTWLNNQFNFLIAVGSFVLALAALLISLI